MENCKYCGAVFLTFAPDEGTAKWACDSYDNFKGEFIQSSHCLERVSKCDKSPGLMGNYERETVKLINHITQERGEFQRRWQTERLNKEVLQRENTALKQQLKQIKAVIGLLQRNLQRNLQRHEI